MYRHDCPLWVPRRCFPIDGRGWHTCASGDDHTAGGDDIAIDGKRSHVGNPRDIARIFFAGVQSAELTPDSRCIVPSHLASYAGFEQRADLIVLFNSDHLYYVRSDRIASESGASWIDGLSSVHWSRSLSQLVTLYGVREAAPIYVSESHLEERLRRANELLESERQTTDGFRMLSGHDFERVVAEVLAEFGIPVVANIPVLGGEVDVCIFLAEDEGVRPVLIECKNRQHSEKPLVISEVHRMFGIQEALRRSFADASVFLVTSTGYTRNAGRFARQFTVQVGDIEALLRFVTRSVESTGKVCPFFQRARFGTRNRVGIPSAFKLGKEVYMTSEPGRGISIWRRDGFERRAHHMREMARSV